MISTKDLNNYNLIGVFSVRDLATMFNPPTGTYVYFKRSDLVCCGFDAIVIERVLREKMHTKAAYGLVFTNEDRKDLLLVDGNDMIFAYEPRMAVESTSGLTEDERAVLDNLVAAWDAHAKLPVQHPTHMNEFMQAIHAAQRIVMSRPVARAEGWIKETANTRINLPE